MTRPYVLTRTVTIVVAAGVGSGSFDFVGEIRELCFIAPSAAARYDWDVRDAAGYGIDGGAGLQGNTTLTVGKLVKSDKASPCTIYLTNATTGTYTARVYGSWGS